MTDFEKETLDDITIFKVNMGRATMKEAGELKKLIDLEILKKKNKLIIDLSQCEFIDSTFIGVLVVTLKKLAEVGGKLRLIQPVSIAHSVLEATGTLNIFEVYKTKSEAVKSLLNNQ